MTTTGQKNPVKKSKKKPLKADRSETLSTVTSQIQSIYELDLQTISKPPENEFFVTDENWEQTLFAITHGMPLLVVGPSGTGKTELLYRAAKAARRNLEAFNMGAMTEPRSALIGVTHFNPMCGTVFQESRFVQNLRRPYTTILLDEVNRAPKEAVNMLIPLLDEQKMIGLDEKEDCEVVHPAEGVGFCATANIGCEYTGTTELDWAVMNRFQIVIHMGFMDLLHEMEVLCKRCPEINFEDVARLVKVAEKQRELWRDGEYGTPITTRSLLAAAKQCAAGVPVDTAFKFCIQNHFSSVGGLASDHHKIAEVWKFSDSSIE